MFRYYFVKYSIFVLYIEYLEYSERHIRLYGDTELSEKKQNTSSTALKVLKVLECLSDTRTPLTISEVCQKTNLDRPTTYRALLTLVESGYAFRDEKAKTFRLSYKLLSMARFMLSEEKNADTIRSTLRKISHETGETCHYSILEGFETVITMREKGNQIVSVDFKIGDRGLLHATSIGKVILAYQSEEFIKLALSKPMERLTPFTICSAQELRRELTRIKTTGLATDDNEMVEGMRCVAVPIIEAGNIIRSGISMSGPVSRYTDTYLRHLGEILLRHSKDITESTAV